ncbi:MAG: rhomboid family intramembrane serine protease [Pseudomonadota bacterium]
MALTGADAVSPAAADLFDHGGIRRSAVLDSQWWRLVSGVLLHGNLQHLFLSVFVLYLSGLIFLMVADNKTFFLVFWLAALIGGSVGLMSQENVVTVTPTAGILGVTGAYLSLFIARKLYSFEAGLALPMILMGLAFGLYPWVDHFANIGGLIAGLLTGFVLQRTGRLAVLDDDQDP